MAGKNWHEYADCNDFSRYHAHAAKRFGLDFLRLKQLTRPLAKRERRNMLNSLHWALYHARWAVGYEERSMINYGTWDGYFSNQ